MAQARIRGGAGAVYHCITRTVNGERILDDVAKEILRKQLHATAAFCGIEIITYVLMENHFHWAAEADRSNPQSETNPSR